MYHVPDQRGHLAIVTGANSGTGWESAARLAAAGTDVVLAVRTPEKGEQACRQILDRYPGQVRPDQLRVQRLDLADLDSVASFAAAVAAAGRPVDRLLNNAGVMVPPTRMTTADGFELQFGTNFLGPFALTLRLLPALLAAPAPRVATMSSMAAYRGRIQFDDLQFEHNPYQPWTAYNQSKLADLLLGQRLAGVAAARGWNLISGVAHPGYVRTNLQTAGASLGGDGPDRLTRAVYRLLPANSLARGTDPLLFAATAPTATNGGFYGPRFTAVGPMTTLSVPRHGRDGTDAERLWDVAERLTGVSLASVVG